MKKIVNSVVFVSNFFNHHQKPFSDAMYQYLGDGYHFIETEPISEERLKMGWGEENIPSFVRKNYVNRLAEIECNNLIEKADVVIIGSAPDHLVRNRIRSGKLVLRYSERLLKKGLELWKYPYRYIKWHRQNPNRANIYMLCASAYTSSDYARFGLFKNRCYKWGYFPAVKRYDDIDQLLELKHPASILWVARLIELKHPELPILVAKRLKDANYSFKMKLIGNGVLEGKIKNLIHVYGLDDCVEMLGIMKPEQVRDYMEKSQIFLFTSDRNEGWGAVLNEAMNSACGVVASSVIGSVPFLVEDGENGYIYKDGDLDDLYNKVKLLLDDRQNRSRLGKNAYITMVDEWNAEIAAERLLCLIEDLVENKISYRYLHGPCSKAERISNHRKS